MKPIQLPEALDNVVEMVLGVSDFPPLLRSSVQSHLEVCCLFSIVLNGSKL